MAFRPVHVFDISQTDGEPLAELPRPQLTRGQAPEGLWEALAIQVKAAGFDLSISPLQGANGPDGVTNFLRRTVKVRDGVDEAHMCVTLGHELLTAPMSGLSGNQSLDCTCDSPLRHCVPLTRVSRCCRAVFRYERAVSQMDQNEGLRDVSTLVVPSVGRVGEGKGVPAFEVLDAAGAPVLEISVGFPSNRGGFFNDGWVCWPRARVSSGRRLW